MADIMHKRPLKVVNIKIILSSLHSSLYIVVWFKGLLHRRITLLCVFSEIFCIFGKVLRIILHIFISHPLQFDVNSAIQTAIFIKTCVFKYFKCKKDMCKTLDFSLINIKTFWKLQQKGCSQ